VVVGGDYQGLGIVRSLGRKGIPVCVVDDERSIARFSRYTTHSVRTGPLRDEDQSVTTILDVGERLGLHGWVLFPTREETVAAFSRHRERLASTFRVPTPDWSRIRWAWDKRATYELAAKLEIPAPRTWIVDDERQLDDIDAYPPFALKPAIKEHFVYATKAKAWRADTLADLRTQYRRAAAIIPPGEILIQELIPGDGRDQFAYCAFFKEGRAIGSLVARRRRQHPPEFGRASTFVQSIRLEELESLSERFLREIDYYGLVELEYKRDPRDGMFKLLDVNARTWGYHTIGQTAGVDFPFMLFCDQVGRPVDGRRARPGVRWIRLVTDVPTAAVEIARGRLSLRSYARSLADSDTEAVFSREDPLPAIAELMLLPYLSVKRGF
jgi:predicted ATP-grasp superfamily ATP-dependent carboligase